MRPVASRPARRSLLLGLAAGIVAGLLLLIGVSLAIGIANAGQVMPGVRIGGVDIGGLDSGAAEARLVDQLPSLSSGSATVVVDDMTEVVGYDELGRRYEMATMVDAALAVARGGDPVGEGIARLRNLFHPVSIPVTIRGYDEAAVERLAAALAERVEVLPADAQVVKDGVQFKVTPSRDGRALEASTASSAIAAALAAADPADVRVTLEPAVSEPMVSTADAWRAARAAERMTATLTLAIPAADEGEEPDPALTLKPETIAAWISFGATEPAPYGVILNPAPFAAALQPLAEVVDQEPVSARFAVAGSGLGGVIAGQDGRTLLVSESVQSLVATLEARAAGRTRSSMLLDVRLQEPGLTTAEAQAALPNMRMVSTWTTNYVPGVSNGFGVNISIPAHDIDGTTVAPGDWFSFWGGLGPINTARGYTQGGAIINGRSEPEGALAGGICSTSTTLFNAAMRLGLEIGDRDNHYYFIDRYPTGLDATVFQSEGFTQDMTFRNDTSQPLVIRGFGSPGRVTFQIWSVPSGRSVALSNATVSNHRPATDTTREDPDMAPGTSKRIESPHNGFDASVSRTVRDAAGTVVHQNTWFSDYRPVNGIVLSGGAAPVPPTAAEGTGGGGTTETSPSPSPSPSPAPTD